MKPKEPISREAREYLLSKLNRMGKFERKKAEKRLEMYDRGFSKKDDMSLKDVERE